MSTLGIVAMALYVSSVALQGNTTIVLGHVERDLTGDGKPEVLRVVGVGPTIEALAVTFTIESAGRTIYRYEMMRLTRAELKEFGPFFFDERKFESPSAFVESLRRQARLKVDEIPDVIERDRDASDTVAGSVIWQEIQSARVTIFWFSPGGDRIEAIGWNARAGRFYRLLDCC